MTIVPSLVVIALRPGSHPTLVVSQVVLSFGLPFALVPLVLFTRDRQADGPPGQPPPHHPAAAGVAGLIIAAQPVPAVQLARGG